MWNYVDSNSIDKAMQNTFKYQRKRTEIKINQISNLKGTQYWIQRIK
jgi:hypothetical protein